jgi:hypothetical protein
MLTIQFSKKKKIFDFRLKDLKVNVEIQIEIQIEIQKLNLEIRKR